MGGLGLWRNRVSKPTKLSQDWKLTDFDIQYAKDRGFTDSEIDDIAESFATWFVEGPGRKQTYICWSGSGRSAWGNWVRRANPKPEQRGRERGIVSTAPRGSQVYDQARGWISMKEYYDS